jgi:hypothetical protein
LLREAFDLAIFEFEQGVARIRCTTIARLFWLKTGAGVVVSEALLTGI